MSLKSCKSFSLSAAIAAILLSGAGAFRTRAADVDNITLQISGAANTSGLFGQIYSLEQPFVFGAEPTLSASDASPNFTAGGFPILQSLLNQKSVNVSGYSNVSFKYPFNYPPYGSTLTGNITARWSGYISLPAGVTTFATNSADGSVIYIDGVRVVNNNQFQGDTRRIGQTGNFASAGVHEIVIASYHRSGGGTIEARYAPGIATTNVNDPAFGIIPVVDGSSNQILTGVQNTVLTPGDGALTFTMAGTTGGVDYTNAIQVEMGALTFAGNNTLNYKGAAARFASTTFNAGGTNVLAVSTGSAFSQDIALGQLNDGGVAVRLQKTGLGQLVLDQTTNANAMSSASVVEIRGSGLILAGTNGGQDPLGAARIELGSTLPDPVPAGITEFPSTLTLTSKSGNVTFDNAVNVTSNNTIVAQQLVAPASSTATTLLQGTTAGVPTAPASVNNVTVTLGSATNAVNVASGQTVTFQTNNGYSLDLAGGVTGAGNVAFLPGSYTLSKQLNNTGTLTTSTTGTSIFNYNVNNALNNRLLAVNTPTQVTSGSPIPGPSQITIASGVTTLGGDTFSIGATSVLTVANPAVGALLTRGVNLTAAALSIIAENEAGGAQAVQGLGTNGDLLFGLSANLSDNVTVSLVPGTTPWGGISTDRITRTMTGGTITASGNFLLRAIGDANLDLGAVSISTPNGPVVANIITSSGRLRTVTGASPGVDYHVTFAVRTGVLQLVAANSLGNSDVAGGNARIVVYPGATLDPDGVANAISGNVTLLHRSTLQLNEANNLGGIGSITGESGAVVQLQNANALGNANAAQTLATLPAGVVYRLEENFGASLAANTNPAGNYVIQGGDRTNSITLSAGTPTRSGYVSGSLTNDTASRTLNSGGAVTIDAGGGTFAAANATTLTIAAPVTVSPGGGRSLTIGTEQFVDNINGARHGTIVLSSTVNNWGSGADALAQLKIVGHANLQNSTSAGVSALPQGGGLAVNLGGVYQINGRNGNSTSTIQFGQITAEGGSIFLNRNAFTPDKLVANLNAPIFRTNTFGPGGRGSVVFQTVTSETLGTNDKVTFSNAANAPARISGTSGTINMVAPWMIGMASPGPSSYGNPNFLDVDPATATTTGFKPVTYVPLPTTGGSGNEIAEAPPPTTLAAPVTVAALRTGFSIDGETINLTTGGLLFRGPYQATISSAINFGAVEGVITNLSGQRDVITGALSGTGGLTKLGVNPLVLSNPDSTLTGGITINEGTLNPGVDNGIPQDNVLTINTAGALDLGNSLGSGFNQAFRGIQGDGEIIYTGSLRTLTLTAPDAGETYDFSGSIRNTGGGLTLTKNGPGTQILSGSTIYFGATNVNEGTLLVDGVSYIPFVFLGLTNFNVASGATLGGSGIILEPINISANGTLAPGDATAADRIASLRTGSLTLAPDANFSFELNGPLAGIGFGAATGYDQVDSLGTVSLDGANLQLALNYAPVFGDKLFIINNDSFDPIVGIFAKLNGTPMTLTEGSIFSVVSSFDSQNYFFRISYQGEFLGGNVNNVGNDVVLVAVPEPGSAALLVTAAAGLLVRRRRKG
jgi:autotransporter-associated beta strand protein